jgi:hypothetical protein
MSGLQRSQRAQILLGSFPPEFVEICSGTARPRMQPGSGVHHLQREVGIGTMQSANLIQNIPKFPPKVPARSMQHFAGHRGTLRLPLLGRLLPAAAAHPLDHQLHPTAGLLLPHRAPAVITVLLCFHRLLHWIRPTAECAASIPVSTIWHIL